MVGGGFMSRGTILIVEDDPAILGTLKEVLELEGYEVLSATHGLDALRVLADSTKPALILLDLMMPVMSGRQFLAHLQGDPELAAIPTVVLSAMLKPEDSFPGVRHVLLKPVDIEQLLEVIAAHCAPAPAPVAVPDPA
jgi:CheY-like chemotaxis protein